ncbi:MAG TPA: glutathione S-transferase family protein [Burkholderiaceae bacterium]|nr:glutathione S-transferase family protein [Burkholderiaceae bacterium]
MKLIIGSKNYSSWSLRSWLLLTQAGIPFEEIPVQFSAPDFKQKVLRHSPAGRVPVLIDGDLTVWDSLAIAEYVAENFADRQLWPGDRKARAEARSVCAEMHAGFQALRNQMPMNVSASLPGRGWNVDVQKDITRIAAIWGKRSRFAGPGPFLFGRFGVADAYFAPVVWRFNTYKPELPAQALDYVHAVLALPAMQAWAADAAREREFIADDEPYRVALA